MGAWGTLPWDSDGGADWFGDMVERTGLAQHVEETLGQDVTQFHEEIRAAAGVLLMMGRVYIWPPGDLIRHLELAASRLGEIANLDIYRDEAADPAFLASLNEEIQELRSRIQSLEKVAAGNTGSGGNPDSGASEAPASHPTQAGKKKWWKF